MYTLLPHIQVYALIYETTHFLEWSGGFVYKCMNQIMQVLVHAPIYEATIRQIII